LTWRAYSKSCGSVIRRYYTPDLANRSLPLVSVIARDVRETAVEMRQVWNSLRSSELEEAPKSQLQGRLKHLQQRFLDLSRELDELGIELKDPFQGLLDFRARRGDDEVYLCWRLGEDRVGHWHELQAGFGGRQPIESF
jgi:hypothetical protein